MLWPKNKTVNLTAKIIILRFVTSACPQISYNCHKLHHPVPLISSTTLRSGSSNLSASSSFSRTFWTLRRFGPFKISCWAWTRCMNWHGFASPKVATKLTKTKKCARASSASATAVAHTHAKLSSVSATTTSVRAHAALESPSAKSSLLTLVKSKPRHQTTDGY